MESRFKPRGDIIPRKVSKQSKHVLMMIVTNTPIIPQIRTIITQVIKNMSFIGGGLMMQGRSTLCYLKNHRMHSKEEIKQKQSVYPMKQSKC